MEMSRLKELAGIVNENGWGNANQENIYDNLSEMDHSELINKLMSSADENPSLTLLDFLISLDINDNAEDEEYM